MNIEDIRFLLSALIQALPMVLSLALIAMFAFLELRKKLVDVQRKHLSWIFIFIAFVSGITIANVIILANLEYYINNIQSTIWLTIILSSIVLFAIPLFIAVVLVEMLKLKGEKIK